MRIEIIGTNTLKQSSEYRNIEVGIQRGKDVIDRISTDTDPARWEIDVDLAEKSGSIDLRGPFVHGKPGDRFLYLSWGTVDEQGAFTMFRRAKLLARDIDPELLERAGHGGSLVARLPLQGKDGTPICGSVRPPAISWEYKAG